MWLPDRVYDRAPLFWLLVGGFFVSGALILGEENPLTPVYFGIGIICVIWSIWVIIMRARRRRREAFGQPRPALDKTQPIQAPSDAVKAAAAEKAAATRTD